MIICKLQFSDVLLNMNQCCIICLHLKLYTWPFPRHIAGTLPSFSPNSCSYYSHLYRPCFAADITCHGLKNNGVREKIKSNKNKGKLFFSLDSFIFSTIKLFLTGLYRLLLRLSF